MESSIEKQLSTYNNLKAQSTAQYQSTLDALNAKIASYNKLSDDMIELRSKSYIETMVPINEIAFFKGHLKHQNEILVFLGDGYFVERTVDECQDIIIRRLKNLTDDKKELEEALNIEESKIQLTNKVIDSTENTDETAQTHWNDDGTLDIREEYHSDDEGTIKETHDFEEIDYTECEIEKQKELEYQKKVKQHSDFEARKKAIEEKLKFYQTLTQKDEPVIEDTKGEEPQASNISETKEEDEEDPIIETETSEQPVFSKIKERNFDTCEPSESIISADPPKKMSKFKMRQMKNK